MSFLGSIPDALGGTAGKIIGAVGNVIDKLHTSDAEKAAAKLEAEKLILQRDEMLELTIRAELDAQERIIVAEMAQGDAYTKRARPTVVYAGLAYFLFAMVAKLFRPELNVTELVPPEFTFTWGGVCGIWFVGRTAERRGAAQSQLVSAVTGNRRR